MGLFRRDPHSGADEVMTAEEGASLLGALHRPDVPPDLDRWRVRLEPRTSRPTAAAEWAGALVVVEAGVLHVDCAAGGTRRFAAGDMLALGWLPLRTLRNAGSVPVELLAVRRRGSRPHGAYLRLLRSASRARTT